MNRGARLGLLVLVMIGCSRREAVPPASWEPDRSCSVDDDCRPAPSCCPVPCTEDVVNRKDLEKVQARVNASCTDKERAACPQAGSCAAHRYSCVHARCALVMEGSPDTPKHDGCPRDPLAAKGKPCKPEGMTCAEGTTFTHLMMCSGGKWTEMEAPPPPPPAHS